MEMTEKHAMGTGFTALSAGNHEEKESDKQTSDTQRDKTTNVSRNRETLSEKCERLLLQLNNIRGRDDIQRIEKKLLKLLHLYGRIGELKDER